MNMWTIQAKGFLSLVLVIVGPSGESRGYDSTLGALLLCIISKARCLGGRLATRNVAFHDVTVDTIVVVVADQSVLADHIQSDEKRCGPV